MSSFLSKADRARVPRLDGRGGDVCMGEVRADDDKCTGCGLCVAACPGKAIVLRGDNQVRMIEAELVPCIACGDCVAICEPAAIELLRPHAYGGLFKTLHRGGLVPPRRF
jgi:ferredoxin